MKQKGGGFNKAVPFSIDKINSKEYHYIHRGIRIERGAEWLYWKHGDTETFLIFMVE